MKPYLGMLVEFMTKPGGGRIWPAIVIEVHDDSFVDLLIFQRGETAPYSFAERGQRWRELARVQDTVEAAPLPWRGLDSIP